MSENDERPAALLTNAQRAYLRGEKEYRPSAERDVRQRIRERLRAGIFDLQMIVSLIPLTDLDKALTEPVDELEPGMTMPLTNAMSALPALIYLNHRETEPKTKGRPDGWRTAYDIEEGIKTALARMGVGYETIEVDIRVERGRDLDEIEGDLANLDRDELGQLHRAGVIDTSEFADALED